MEPPPINERFAPAEGYTTHEALKAIFRHYADSAASARRRRRGVDRAVGEAGVGSPDLGAARDGRRDLVFAKVAARGAPAARIQPVPRSARATSLRLYAWTCGAFAALCASLRVRPRRRESDARGTVRRVLDTPSGPRRRRCGTTCGRLQPPPPPPPRRGAGPHE